ncbi:MAG: hypothetical protein AAGF12_25335 [Myxococcota bacterium]
MLIVGSDFTNLVYHGLAFARVAHHSSLWDPAYLRWARTTLPTDSHRWFDEDARAFEALYHRSPAAEALHGFPMGYADIESFLQSAGAPVEALDTAHPFARTLRQLPTPLVELFRANLALSATAYRDEFARSLRTELATTVDRVQPHLDAALSIDESLDDKSIELVFSLGPRGRGLGTRLVVGAPVPWTSISPATPIVLALHESAVGRASIRNAGYVRSELTALIDLSIRIAGAPSALQEAHTDWVNRLALDSLIDTAVANGLLTRDAGTELRKSKERSRLLRRLGRESR